MMSIGRAFFAFTRLNSPLLVDSKWISYKHFKHLPRPYRRRLYEAAVRPVLPSRKFVPGAFCGRISYLDIKAKSAQESELSQMELALCDLVRDLMRNYRIMAVCQLLPIEGRLFYLAKNQMRLRGLETRCYSNRIMRHIFAHTPLATLEPLFCANTVVIFGRDLEAIKNIVEFNRRYSWFTPLALTVDDRILSVKETTELAKFDSLDQLFVETVGLLAAIPQTTVQALEHHSRLLVANLDSLIAKGTN